jgi:hypothetical protein
LTKSHTITAPRRVMPAQQLMTLLGPPTKSHTITAPHRAPAQTRRPFPSCLRPLPCPRWRPPHSKASWRKLSSPRPTCSLRAWARPPAPGSLKAHRRAERWVARDYGGWRSPQAINQPASPQAMRIDALKTHHMPGGVEGMRVAGYWAQIGTECLPPRGMTVPGGGEVRRHGHRMSAQCSGGVMHSGVALLRLRCSIWTWFCPQRPRLFNRC